MRDAARFGTRPIAVSAPSGPQLRLEVALDRRELRLGARSGSELAQRVDELLARRA